MPDQLLEFRLPDLGEGLADAELVEWSVQVGDIVELNQPIVDVETAKAVVSVPSPFAGEVVELLAEPGETVEVGAVLIRVAGTGSDAVSGSGGMNSAAGEGSRRSRRKPANAPSGGGQRRGGGGRLDEADRASTAAEDRADPPGRIRRGDDTDLVRGEHFDRRERDVDGRDTGDVDAEALDVSGERKSVLDASGPAESDVSWRQNDTKSAVREDVSDTARASAAADDGASGSADAGDRDGAQGGERKSVLVGYGPEQEGVSRRRKGPESAAQEVVSSTANAQAGRSSRPAAVPSARKLARELGVDLWELAGSGPDGAVTVDDVRAVSRVDTASGNAADRGTPVASDRETRTPVSGIRKRTAAAMVTSARTIPQASTSVTVDVTASIELLEHLRGTKSFADLPLTPLALVSRAVLAALTEFPGINAAWDEDAQQIITKHYVNLGIAVAAERGLLVPNIKDAHALSLRELCAAIARLAESARAATATPADLTGGTFTISNVGVFGVDTGIPLVNPGEAAILCLGSIAKRPWVIDDELAIRRVTTLALSFDHRLIDGEQAARFLATLANFLEDPLVLLGRL
ncbi:dihydrolipoamide acetyltransferase family protein [Nocardia callitridis]|uniref:Dihydrolipoamide acetyltransferase component of pyruvate dehydrogenase complex n=1 Tax=Nocardia callitridis TaxID=648753 RepID=A0ABP9L3P7_9NOCA